MDLEPMKRFYTWIGDEEKLRQVEALEVERDQVKEQLRLRRMVKR